MIGDEVESGKCKGTLLRRTPLPNHVLLLHGLSQSNATFQFSSHLSLSILPFGFTTNLSFFSTQIPILSHKFIFNYVI